MENKCQMCKMPSSSERGGETGMEVEFALPSGREGHVRIVDTTCHPTRHGRGVTSQSQRAEGAEAAGAEGGAVEADEQAQVDTSESPESPCTRWRKVPCTMRADVQVSGQEVLSSDDALAVACKVVNVSAAYRREKGCKSPFKYLRTVSDISNQLLLRAPLRLRSALAACACLSAWTRSRRSRRSHCGWSESGRHARLHAATANSRQRGASTPLFNA